MVAGFALAGTDTSGFAVVGIVLALTSFLAIGAAAWYVLRYAQVAVAVRASYLVLVIALGIGMLGVGWARFVHERHQPAENPLQAISANIRSWSLSVGSVTTLDYAPRPDSRARDAATRADRDRYKASAALTRAEQTRTSDG
jgi:hypothetical protein